MEEPPAPEDAAIVDPVTAAAVAKVATTAADEVVKAGLLVRVLGPAADELGEALKRYTAFRTRNVGRIVEKADKKSRPDSEDYQVNPRVAHRLLEEGSYCDDELMAEYLGGMLAGSRTPNGRDDRAVAWSQLVASLSALQIRAHYLLYSTWASVLCGREDLNIGLDAGRESATLDVELGEFAARLIADSEMEMNVALLHAIPGLVRIGLLGDSFGIGERSGIAADSTFEFVLRVQPSVAGVELFGWAIGNPNMTSKDFVQVDLPVDESLPGPLAAVALPRLSQESATQGQAPPEAAPLT